MLKIESKKLSFFRFPLFSFVAVIGLGLFIAGPFLFGSNFAGFFIKAPITSAQTSACVSPNVFVSGYAWSSNIGWVSMSGKAQDNSEYGVCLDQTTGNLTGYAWSPNIGWIKFNPNVDEFNVPKNGLGLNETPIISAALDSNSGVVKGWARTYTPILAEGANGLTSGGWDGWIKMSGNAVNGQTYGVTVDSSGNWDNYAWGGDVIGWINFNGVSVNLVSSEVLEISSFSAYPDSSYLNPLSKNNPITLTVNVSGSAVNGENLTFDFYCGISGETPMHRTSDNPTQEFSCAYSSDGAYNAKAVVSKNSNTVQAITTVYIGEPQSCSDNSECAPGRCDGGSCDYSCSPSLQCSSGAECSNGVCIVPVCSDCEGQNGDPGGGGEDITTGIQTIIEDPNKVGVNETEKIIIGDDNPNNPNDPVNMIIDKIIAPAANISPKSTKSYCQELGLDISWVGVPAPGNPVAFTGNFDSAYSAAISKFIWMLRGETVANSQISESDPHKAIVEFNKIGRVGNKVAVVLGVKLNTGLGASEVCYASKIIFVGGRTEE